MLYHNTQRAEWQSQLAAANDLHKMAMEKFNEGLEQINLKLSTSEVRNENLEKRLQEMEVDMVRNYISRTEHTRLQGELVAEIKTLERKLDEAKTEIMQQWKDFVGQLTACQVKNHVGK